MGATWNGNVVPEDNDFWNLISDMRWLAESNNRVIPAFSSAERNALTGPAGGGVPDGTVVLRLDRYGVFDVRVNGGWLEGDSGWVSMQYRSGFSAGTPGQMAYKIAGNTLHVKGGVTSDSGAAGFPDNTYVQPSSTLIPAEFRPTDTQYFGTVGTAGRPAGLQISSNGYIQVVSPAQNDAGILWISTACTLPLT